MSREVLRRHAPCWLMLAGALGLNALSGGPASLGSIRDLLPDVALTAPLAVVFAALWLGYAGVALAPRPLAPAWPLAYGAVLVAVFALTPASFSIDLLDYIRRGRILSVYGANPHVTAAASFPHDPFYGGVGWTFLATPYGPAFTLLSAALTRLAGDAWVANVLAFKLAMVAAHGLNGVLVRRIAGSERAGILYLLNPFILFEVVANGHNDVLPLAAALASLACTRSARPVAAAAFLALAAWIKIPFAVLFPLWLRYAGVAGQRRALVAGLGAAAAVSVLLWLPFFAGTSVFHVYRLHAGMQTKWSLPALLGGALAGAGLADAGRIAAAVCAAVALAALAPAVVRASSWPAYRRAAVITSLVVPLVGMAWLLPWYFVWPLGFLPLLSGRRSTAAILALTASGFAHYVQQSYLGFDSSYGETAILGLTSIAPVFVVLLVVRRPRPRS